jgi:hypothetical protein
VTNTAEDEEIGNSRIVLGLLQSVEGGGHISQRRLASELGIALGLVNIYLRRCVKKGWVKVTEAPARRYAYYLTPRGFAEKSRLTIQYFSSSFAFFRSARSDCVLVLQEARAHGWNRIALAGISDLAEISIICALESSIEVVAVVDPGATTPLFLGRTVAGSFKAILGQCDAIVLSDLREPAHTMMKARRYFSAERVLVPALLSGRVNNWRAYNRDH